MGNAAVETVIVPENDGLEIEGKGGIDVHKT